MPLVKTTKKSSLPINEEVVGLTNFTLNVFVTIHRPHFLKPPLWKNLVFFNIKVYQNRLASDIFNRQITKISISANIFFKIILHQCREKMW